MKSGSFSWDDSKAAINCAKHRIPFDKALTVFADPFYRAYEDPDHSSEEERYIAIGQSRRGRILVVAYKYHAESTRIISARKAARRERRFYEESL